MFHKNIIKTVTHALGLIFFWSRFATRPMFYRTENNLKGRFILWRFPHACSPPCPPCSVPRWRDALSQGIHQPVDQQGCYPTRPSVVLLLAVTACLRTAKHVGILALYLKGSPCSLNNSKVDICVTFSLPYLAHEEQCAEFWQYTTDCVLGTGKILPFQSRNPAKKPWMGD